MRLADVSQAIPEPEFSFVYASASSAVEGFMSDENESV